MSNGKKERQRWNNRRFVTGRNDFGNSHTILIPGEEWHPLDGVPAPEYVPEQWDGPHVGLRLVEAFKTLANLPGGDGPGSTASSFWPEYWHDWEDALAQEGQADVKADTAAKANQSRVRPSAQDITRMDKAISWPGEYLAADPAFARLAHVVQRVAFYRSREMDMDYVARRMKRNSVMLRQDNRDGLDRIADCLRRDGVPIF